VASALTGAKVIVRMVKPVLVTALIVRYGYQWIDSEGFFTNDQIRSD